MVRISRFSLKLKLSQLNLIDYLKHTKNLTKGLIRKYSADFNGFVLNLKREYLVLVSKSFNILIAVKSLKKSHLKQAYDRMIHRVMQWIKDSLERCNQFIWPCMDSF